MGSDKLSVSLVKWKPSNEACKEQDSQYPRKQRGWCILVKLYMSLGTESRREKPPVCGANVNGKRKEGRPRGPRGPGRKLPGTLSPKKSYRILLINSNKASVRQKLSV